MSANVSGIGQNPFENLQWLSRANGVEETSGTLASKEPNLFDDSNVGAADSNLFANNDRQFEETSGQIAAGASLCAIA